jgi:uncharacterized membrane protein (UPF0127 family)
MRTWILAAIGAALVAAACHRAPEELVSTTASSSATSSATSTSTSTGTPTATPTRVPGCPDDPEPHPKTLPTAVLTISGFDTKPFTVEAEIARGDHDTQRGLMYRTSMPEMHGMLFELDRNDHMFWMHNTCISLDLVYIDRGVVVGIVESAPILDDEPRGVGKLSDQVLELNAGFCQRHGLKVGQHVTRAG